MSTTFHRMAASQPPGKGKVVVGKSEKEKQQQKKTGVKITVAIFFDGTGNNENNIKKRLKDPQYMLPARRNKDERESYAQYYSNVALLHFMHKKKEAAKKIASVYIEGIGTTNDGDDDMAGSAFGAGSTGVVDRVTEGISRLAKATGLLYDKKAEYIEELTVYAFGFSRGAAAARHFLARLHHSRGRASNLCSLLVLNAAVIKVPFAGLFDCVSSFDEKGDKPGDVALSSKIAGHGLHGDQEFRNDQPELHLFLDDPKVLKVIHLAANDEYRLNFSRTDIGSAIKRGAGAEILLPGAHSDVGGGYANPVTEIREYDQEADFKFFEQLGWYGPEQVERDTSFSFEHLYDKTITGTRRIPNTYQYVALSIMLKLAQQGGMVFQNPNADEDRGVKYIINPGSPLHAIKTKLESFALAHASGGSHTAQLPTAEYKWLRQHYLHLSWSDKVGFEFRRELDLRKITYNQPIRLVLPG